MRKRSSAKQAANEALGNTNNAAPTGSPPKVAGSVKAEKPPELKERQQSGSGGYTRASRITMSGFENIVDSLFKFDPDEVYEHVLNSLELAGQASRTDYGDLVDALDAAEENARKALQLLANAKVAAVNYENDIKVLEAELHEQAVSEIMAKYDDPMDKSVTKKPTVADIEAYKISTYHDEWHDMKERVTKAKRTVEYMEGLAGLTAQRARDLRQMVASCRGAG